MLKTPIKIKRENRSLLDSPHDSRVDLRRVKKSRWKSLSKRQSILIVFFLLAAGFLGYSLSLFEGNEFEKIAPENTVVLSLINQNAFYDQVSSFGNNGIQAQLHDYLKRNNLNIEKDIRPLFEKEAAFMLFSPNSETSFLFIVVLRKKKSLSGLDSVFQAIKTGLKKNWNIFPNVYRQVEVEVIKPVISFSSGLPDLYVFAQTRDYFIISNSEEAMKKIIDSVMGG